MKFTLEMTMKNSEGVLERVLGRLRQRCLSIYAVNASCSEDLKMMSAKITFETSLGGETIAKQIKKLYDVMHVNLLNCETTNVAKLIKHDSHNQELALSAAARRNK